MAPNLIFNLSAGQLAAVIGAINVALPIIIVGIGAIAIMMNVSEKMTALEWTTLSKMTQKSVLDRFGAGGQPALTGIHLWGIGSYKRNMLYLLVGSCPILLVYYTLVAVSGSRDKISLCSNYVSLR